MFAKIDALNLEDEDIFIPLGPSRTGKGTLLAALQGHEMKLFRRKGDVKQTAAGKEAVLMTFMAPVSKDNDELPDVNAIVSHQHNSHTIYPKITAKPADKFKGLENVRLVDFPGMFDCKGVILDIALELSLQRILMQARSAKLVLLVSAGVFTPENSKMITEIKSKLNDMFAAPEKHVLIAVTKAKLFEQSFDEEDIIPMAKGRGGQNVSFRGYEVVIVSQDDAESMQAMISAVHAQGCIKNHVKMGFFDPSVLQKLLERVEIKAQFEGNRAAEIVSLLSPVLNKVAATEPVSEIFQRVFDNFQSAAKAGKLNDEAQQSILRDLAAIHDYQMKMKECWDSLRSPVEVKSIMGLIPEYEHINVILDNDQYDNPSLNHALYTADRETLDHLKEALMVMRKRVLQELQGLVRQLKEIGLLSEPVMNAYIEQCQEVNHKVEEELDNMGFDAIK